jgi:ketosteroid isomerase-like protein
MGDDRTAIRELIERWAAALHDGDLKTMVADHADAVRSE